jgi:transglutaminase-like putative cysteine protease
MSLAGTRGPTLLQAQQAAGTLTATFAFAACAVSGELGPALVALFPLALAGSLFFAHRLQGKAEWAWTALLGGALLFFAAQVGAGQLDIVLGAARFAELLCIHRFWHRRSERDELLLLLLSLLLLCAGAALAAEVSFGFAFLGFAVSGTWAMALTHLRFEIEAGRGPAGSAALLNSRRVATPALLGGLAALATLGIAGAAVVFFIFPRMTIGGMRRASRASPVAGLGDRVDLSRAGTVADDPRVALRVRLDPPPPGEPRDLGMHWRARSLSRWTGQGWQAQEGGIIPATRLPPRPRLGRPPVLLSADVEVVGTFADGVVFTPEGWPLSVDFRRPGPARPAPQRLYRNAAGDLFYQPVDGNDLRYVVAVDREVPDLGALRGRGQRYAAWLAPDLAVPPELDARVGALARRLGEGKDPADAAAAIERWLAAALRYTRELPGEVQDPIVDFLFVRRAGHCELFSSAMVLMLRVLGIPARNVTGYFGGRSTDAGYYAVRAGDAHSWVEAYFPEVGFVRFDPTPPSARGSIQESAWARMVLFWDALEQRWRALVVEYDLISQAQAVRRMGQLLSETGRRLSGKSGAAGRLRLVAGTLLVLLLAGALGWAVQRLRQRGRPGRQAALTADQRRALRLWRAARARLRRAGIPASPGTTPGELARKAPGAGELAAAYARARWGGARLSGREAHSLLRGLDAWLRDRVAPDPSA